MRDPKRIPETLNRLQEVWKKFPDLRLGQLIGNVFKDTPGAYYVEDEDFIEKIEESYGNKNH